jgi:glutathione S-transferase
MFAAEKGIQLEIVDVDIIGGENRQAGFLALNPSGTTPVLELGTGQVISETTAICEYLEEIFPCPPLIGTTVLQRAQTRMWLRRVDQAVVQPMTAGFRAAEGFELFNNRVRCYPQAADQLKLAAGEGLCWLDEQLGTQPFICGERLTVADLLLFCFLEFGAQVGQGLDSGRCGNLARWHAAMGSRVSALS